MSTDDDIAFGDGAPDDDLAEEARAALAELEGLPLAERAPAYDAFAARLRDELEQSDPARTPHHP